MKVLKDFVKDMTKYFIVRPFKKITNRLFSINPVIFFLNGLMVAILQMLGLNSIAVLTMMAGLIMAIMCDNLSARSLHIKMYGSMDESRRLQKWTSKEERKRMKVKLIDYLVFYVVLSIIINTGNGIADLQLLGTFTVAQLQEILRVLVLAGLVTIELGSIKENVKYGKEKNEQRKLDEISDLSLMLYERLKGNVNSINGNKPKGDDKDDRNSKN